MAGPLAGLKIIEIAAIGPAPFAAMMLADHGAEVIRVDRPDTAGDSFDPLLRNRKSVVLDLKSEAGRAQLIALAAGADALIEGFRPGVMERLGLGPDVLLTANPRLVYARMTGWGQEGPNATLAGHDINFIALSGALAAIGEAEGSPVPPLNLVGDFGGGAMFLAFGVLAALLSVRNGGPGQVIDCAMTDGSALLMNMIWGFRAKGEWIDQRGYNVLDSGAPYYGAYETADGQYIALGAIEPKFHAEMLRVLELDAHPLFAEQDDRSRWPEQKRLIAECLRSRTRDAWIALFSGVDACFSPVQSLSEAHLHPHNAARKTFVTIDGVRQAAPAPRYSATPCRQPLPPRAPGADQALLERTASPADQTT